MNTNRGATGTPDDRGTRGGHPTQHTYYRSVDVVVTDRWFVTADRTYAVTHLDDVNLARGAYDPVVVTGTVAAVLVLATAGVVAAELPMAIWPVLGALALAAVGGAALLARVRPRRYELWAAYRGAVVPLYSSRDEKTFGHVCRALIRAREQELRVREEAVLAQHVAA